MTNILPPLYRNHWPKLAFVIFLTGLGFSLALLPLKLAGVAVAGAILFFLILLQPKTGLYLLIITIPFRSLVQVSLGGATIGLMEGLLGLMLLAWLLSMTVQGKIVIPYPPLLWPFLIFLGAIALSWLNTVSIRASLIETIKWLEMLALYLFICANFEAKESRWLVMALMLAGLAQAGLGLYQFLFKAGPEGFLLFGGRFLRAFGTFRQPNPYAGYLGLILPLSLAVTLWGLDHLKGLLAKPRGAGLFILAGSSLGLMLIALFASQSRGAWIAFLGAAMVTVLLKGGRWALALTGALIAAAILISMGALALLPETVSQRFVDALPFLNIPDITRVELTDANFAILERLAHWRAAEGMWLDHLWLGVGFGNYEVVYPAYAIGRWLDPLGHAHNYFLNLGAEAGIVGLVGYFLFWAWVTGYAMYGLLRSKAAGLNRAILAGCMGIIAHLHIHNLLDNLYVQGMYLHIALVLSLITLIVLHTRPSGSL